MNNVRFETNIVHLKQTMFVFNEVWQMSWTLSVPFGHVNNFMDVSVFFETMTII